MTRSLPPSRRKLWDEYFTAKDAEGAERRKTLRPLRPLRLSSELSDKRPLNIIFITSNLAWRGGGTFYRALGFGKNLVARGHRVTLLATAPDEKWRFASETVNGVEVVVSPALLGGKLRSGWDGYEVVRRWGWLNGRSYDIIHGFESRPVVIHPARRVLRRGGVLLLDWCDWLGTGGLIEERPFATRLLLRRIEDFYETHFRTQAAGTTVINQTLQNRAQQMGIDPATILWLPNGSEPEGIPRFSRREARQGLGLDPNALYIGHLGHALPNDGRMMAAAFAQIQAARPESKLLIIGDYRQTILAHVAEKKTAVDTGFVQGITLHQYLAACDVLWLPLQDTLTNRGRWPMKLSDYMVSGRPVVSTAVGDLRPLFTGEHPIGLVARDEAAEFAAQTLYLLANPELGHGLGENGRFLAETQFNGRRIAASLEQFYYRCSAE